jgi:hypothetical protein
LLFAGTAEATILAGNWPDLLVDNDGLFETPEIIGFDQAPFAVGQPFAWKQSGNTTVGDASSSLVVSTYPAGDPMIWVNGTGSVQISFAIPVNRVGFSYGSANLAPVQFEVFGTGGVSIFDTATTAATIAGFLGEGFLGFQSKTDIDHVVISGWAGDFYIDNVTSEAGVLVPEPASLAIWSVLGLGLIGIGWRRRR